MDDTQPLAADSIREQLRHTYDLFADIRRRFDGPGGEGIRDLIRLYCAHLLEHAIGDAETPAPDLLAFVNIHDHVRRDESGAPVNIRYEVWCPGNDFSRAYFSQCEAAARALVQQHGVRSAYPLHEEVRLLPPEISAYMTEFVQRLATPVLQHYAII
jgi:hypothetical protein